MNASGSLLKLGRLLASLLLVAVVLLPGPAQGQTTTYTATLYTGTVSDPDASRYYAHYGTCSSYYQDHFSPITSTTFHADIAAGVQIPGGCVNENGTLDVAAPTSPFQITLAKDGASGWEVLSALTVSASATLAWSGSSSNQSSRTLDLRLQDMQPGDSWTYGNDCQDYHDTPAAQQSAAFACQVKYIGNDPIAINIGDASRGPDYIQFVVTVATGYGDQYDVYLHYLLTAGTGCSSALRNASGSRGASDACQAPDVTIDHIEFVQATTVTGPSGSLIAVAGKDTMMRVFPKATGQALDGVTAKVTCNGKILTSAPGTAKLAPDRAQIGDSLNVLLDPAMTTAGEQSFSVQLMYPGTDPYPGTNRNQTVTKVFTAVPRQLNVGWIPICVHLTDFYQLSQQFPGNQCPTYNAPAYIALTRSTFPLPAVNVNSFQLPMPETALTWDQSGGWTVFTNKTHKVLALFKMLWNMYVPGLMDHLVGWIPIVTSPRPLLNPAWSEDVSVAGRYDVSYGSDFQSRYSFNTETDSFGRLVGMPWPSQDMLAYRLARQLGVPPSISPIGEVGVVLQGGVAFDQDAVVLPNTLDVSNLGVGQPHWISPATWTSLYTALTTPAPPPPQSLAEVPATPAAAQSPTEFAIVSGTIQQDNSSAQIDPIVRITSTVAPAALSTSGAYCLQVSNAAAALATTCFDVSFLTDPTGAVPPEGIFVVDLPWPAGATRVALLHGTATLTSLTAAAGNPTVTIASPHQGDHWTGPNTITWTTTGMASTVLYSYDGGNTWIPLAVNTTDSQLAVDPTSMRGGSQVYFRVIASSGINTASATVGPLTITQTPAIAAPATLDFGTLTTGQSADMDLLLSNTGSGPLTIQSLTRDNTAFTVVGPPTPFDILGGSASSVSIRCTPGSTAGTQNGHLTIQSTDPANSLVTVLLVCRASATPVPNVLVPPTTLDFGDVQVGQTLDLTVNLVNNGTAGLNVTAPPPTGPFHITAGAPPFTVDPYGQQTITVTFAPLTTGSQAGVLTLSTNDTLHPTLTVQLTGNGVPNTTARYLLTTSASPAAGGTIAVSPTSSDGTYTAGASVQLTATPASGYQFSAWSGDLTGSTNPQSITLNAARTVTATFTATGPQPPTVVRTLVYHQITSSANSVLDHNGAFPVLSRNGTRAVFAVPGTAPNTTQIYVVNFDGSGLTLADTFPASGAVATRISEDGSAVATVGAAGTSGTPLRFARSDGTVSRTLVTGASIPALAISADGAKVFFLAWADWSGGTVGLYVINTDGTGLRQIVSARAVCTFLGTPGQTILMRGFNWDALDVSRDGSKVIFEFEDWGAGKFLMGINADGTNLHKLIGPIGGGVWGNSAAISADGSTVYYNVGTEPCCSSPNRIGVMNFDGSNNRVLANGLDGSFGQISADGSQVLSGDSGRIYSSNGSGFFTLAQWTGGWLGSGTWLATMNGGATRFLGVMRDGANIDQLYTIELNPTGLGAAPAVSNPTVTPPYLLPNTSSWASVTAGATASNTLLFVGYVVMQTGLQDTTIGNSSGYMFDDGSHGDATAHDQVFTYGWVNGSPTAALGPRSVRVEADSREGADGTRRHATVVEISPFTVVASAPASVTVATVPAGLAIVVDGVSLTAPQTFTWTVGGSHTLSVASPQTLSGTQYVFSGWSDGGAQAHSVTASASVTSYTATFTVPTSGLAFFPVTPCRVADTRNSAGTFGGPQMAGGSTRSFPVPTSSCNIPSTAQAYSLNVTVVPPAPLTYLTIWPAGQTQPLVSTLNSFDGAVVANAAIVPAGTNGAVSVFVSDRTDVILDINGYFAPPTASGLAFYPATPCRIADTRNANGAFGGPIIGAGQTRTFQVPSSACNIPSTAQAYSLNMTVVPPGQLIYLTTWPSGQTQPLVSTLNAFDGRVAANAAIVPAGTNGSISVFVSDASHVIVDVNGYFAPPGAAGALYFYKAAPCRIADTRTGSGFTGSFGAPVLAGGATRNFPIPSSACNIPSTAQAYSLNMTVVPPGPLTYLTTWPAAQPQPLVSTLNSFQGKVVANAAIVPAGGSGAISVYVSNPTNLIVDVNGYFAQ